MEACARSLPGEFQVRGKLEKKIKREGSICVVMKSEVREVSARCVAPRDGALSL